MNQLPIDMTRQLQQYLDYKDLSRLHRSNRRLQDICQEQLQRHWAGLIIFNWWFQHRNPFTPSFYNRYGYHEDDDDGLCPCCGLDPMECAVELYRFECRHGCFD